MLAAALEPGCYGPPPLRLAKVGRAAPVSSPNGPLIILGDTQRTAWFEQVVRENNEQAQQHLMIQIAGDAERLRPAFLVHLGDMVVYGSSEQQWRYYEALVKPLTQRGIRIRPVMGNHDYWGGRMQALALAVREYPELRERTYYADAFLGLGLIWLDTASDDAAWCEQLAWVGKRLQEFEADDTVRGVIVFTHHPPFTKALHRSGSPRALELVRRLRAHRKFVGLFSGHVHGYERRTEDGRTYVISGGGGGPRVSYRGKNLDKRDATRRTVHGYRLGPRYKVPLNYLILTVHKSHLAVTARCLEGTEGCVTGVLDEFSLNFARARPATTLQTHSSRHEATGQRK